MPDSNQRVDADLTPGLTDDGPSDEAAQNVSNHLNRLAARHDRVRAFLDTHDHAEKPGSLFSPLNDEYGTAIIRSYGHDDAILLVDESGEEPEFVTIENAYCPECDHDNTFRSKRGEAVKTAYQRRIDSYCPHYRSFEFAQALYGPCPECGTMPIREKRSHRDGEWVMSTYYCVGCDARRGSE